VSETNEDILHSDPERVEGFPELLSAML